jgi:hypothetical protein
MLIKDLRLHLNTKSVHCVHALLWHNHMWTNIIQKCTRLRGFAGKISKTFRELHPEPLAGGGDPSLHPPPARPCAGALRIAGSAVPDAHIHLWGEGTCIHCLGRIEAPDSNNTTSWYNAVQQLLHSQYSEVSKLWAKAIIAFIVPGSDVKECKTWLYKL